MAANVPNRRPEEQEQRQARLLNGCRPPRFFVRGFLIFWEKSAEPADWLLLAYLAGPDSTTGYKAMINYTFSVLEPASLQRQIDHRIRAASRADWLTGLPHVAPLFRYQRLIAPILSFNARKQA